MASACHLSKSEEAVLFAGGIVIYDSVFSNIAVGAGFGFLTITEGELTSTLLLQLRPDTLAVFLKSYIQPDGKLTLTPAGTTPVVIQNSAFTGITTCMNLSPASIPTCFPALVASQPSVRLWTFCSSLPSQLSF